LRLAILLRGISTMRLEHPAGALDVDRWRMRLRLHPIDNGCEMNLLFTPQMYETTELAALSREIDAGRAREREFVCVDIGANVGLFSMFVAAAAGTGAKIIAVEPESGNFERLLFNIQSNPGVPIRAIRAALSDEPGELVVERLGKDRGGTRARLACSSADLASIAAKRTCRLGRRRHDRRRGVRRSDPRPVLSRRTAEPLAKIACHRGCRRRLVD